MSMIPALFDNAARFRMMLPAFLLLLAPAWSTAADRAVRVEVVAFAQPGADGAPYWQDTRVLPVCHAVALRDGGGAEAAFTDTSTCSKQPGFDAAFGGFSAIGSNALPASVTKLKAGNYSILLNRNWQQVNANLSPVMLRGGTSVGGRQQFEGTVGLQTTPDGLEARIDFTITRMDGPKPQYVAMQESRIIRPGEVQYFDNPLAGIVLLVSYAP